MAPEASAILSLSNELLREILDQIEADPEKLVSLDRRAYLSQESFKPPAAPPLSQAQDVGNFRLACRRFGELGATHQFARVTTRFSARGLRRLEKIAARPHLASQVRKFSYMVPYFYVEGEAQSLHPVAHRPLTVSSPGRERAAQYLLRLKGSLGVDVHHFIRKVTEQEDIVTNEKDVRALKLALSAFTSLQHIQILRVQDFEDGILIEHLRQHQDRGQSLTLRWAPACSHSTRTLAAALLESHSPCSRFSSPMLSPQSAVVLAKHPPRSLATLVSRLTSLELHFDDPTELDERMLQLSDLFRKMFSDATNLQAVHIGFPTHRPLTLKLEDLFHGITFEKLSAFGIQAWKLEASEIVGLVRRHRERLRGLRLRDVLLLEESMWKDILPVLRDECPRLDWVSLRRIGYARHFDEQWATVGIEIEDPPGGNSSSDDEDAFDEAASDHGSEQGIGADDESMADMSDDGHDENEGDDDENGPHAHEMGFPALSMEAVADAGNCNGRPSEPGSTEELGDNGVFVSNIQRKTWERWCIRRFSRPGHRNPASAT